MVVDEVYINCLPSLIVPVEDETPLLIHSNTPVLLQVALEEFKHVARRCDEVFERISGFQDLELAFERPRQIGRILLWVWPTVEVRLEILVSYPHRDNINVLR